MNAKAVTEGEELSTILAPFALALMNLPDVPVKRSPGEAFPAELALDFDRLRHAGKFPSVVLFAGTMVLLVVSAHVRGGHHFLTLRTLALRSGFLGWHRRCDLHIVVIVVGVCVYGPTRDVQVKSIRKEWVVVPAARERIHHFIHDLLYLHHKPSPLVAEVGQQLVLQLGKRHPAGLGPRDHQLGKYNFILFVVDKMRLSTVTVRRLRPSGLQIHGIP